MTCSICKTDTCRAVTAPSGDRIVEELNCARRRITALEAAGDALAREANNAAGLLCDERKGLSAEKLWSRVDAWTKARTA